MHRLCSITKKRHSRQRANRIHGDQKYICLVWQSKAKETTTDKAWNHFSATNRLEKIFQLNCYIHLNTTALFKNITVEVAQSDATLNSWCWLYWLSDSSSLDDATDDNTTAKMEKERRVKVDHYYTANHFNIGHERSGPKTHLLHSCFLFVHRGKKNPNILILTERNSLAVKYTLCCNFSNDKLI